VYAQELAISLREAAITASEVSVVLPGWLVAQFISASHALGRLLALKSPHSRANGALGLCKLRARFAFLNTSNVILKRWRGASEAQGSLALVQAQQKVC
jgi:hypothetical protein